MNTDKGFIERAAEGRRVRNKVSWVIALVCALVLFASMRVDAGQAMQQAQAPAKVVNVDITLADHPWTAGAAALGP